MCSGGKCGAQSGAELRKLDGRIVMGGKCERKEIENKMLKGSVEYE